MGYPCGWWASILFSAHFPLVQASHVPKLFVQGSLDGFTGPDTLRAMATKCCGSVNDIVIVPDRGHFELEDPRYDTFKAQLVHKFVTQHFLPVVAPEMLSSGSSS